MLRTIHHRTYAIIERRLLLLLVRHTYSAARWPDHFRIVPHFRSVTTSAACFSFSFPGPSGTAGSSTSFLSLEPCKTLADWSVNCSSFCSSRLLYNKPTRSFDHFASRPAGWTLQRLQLMLMLTYDRRSLRRIHGFLCNASDVNFQFDTSYVSLTYELICLLEGQYNKFTIIPSN